MQLSIDQSRCLCKVKEKKELTEQIAELDEKLAWMESKMSIQKKYSDKIASIDRMEQKELLVVKNALD